MANEDDSNWIDDDEFDTTLAAAPPGEEGFFISHAGGEASLQQLFVESLAERYVDPEIPHNAECTDHSYRKRHDFRTRQDRVERQMYLWQLQLPNLVDAYLQYQAHGSHGSGVCEADKPGQWDLQVIDFASMYVIPSIQICH